MSVKHETLVGSYEIALLLGVGRARVHQIINAEPTATTPAFPEPIAALKMGHIWLLKDVQDWALAASRTLLPLATIGNA